MPKEIFKHLRRVFVCGQALKIRLDEGPGGQRSRKPHRGAEGKEGRKGGKAARDKKGKKSKKARPNSD